MKSHTRIQLAIGWLLALGIASTMLTVLAFYMEFRTQPVQNDSGAWANFGTYFGGVLGPILALINLAAILLIAIGIVEQQQRTLSSKRLSIDLMTEWHAPPLHESRRLVSDAIDQVDRQERTLPTFWELEQTEPELSLHAFRLYHFFEKWAVLVEVGEVDQLILNKALGSRALWYRTKFFEPIRQREANTDMLKTLNQIEAVVFQPLLGKNGA